ncbi:MULTISPECIES: MarR family winged helix-turn-helix transcriptional regulator [unclassified Curtobacterium]|uniref:MarR family winged helix-turn-helix transcriptional regulator n=1 Tax=unclassified Curtobacterium TaxID=257496 RepID=UPI000826B76B|nr:MULTISPECIES: MarR family transcriptional regulator [unclassified Curtobacterium]WIA97484.1 MarR family transcriptional regulator [Curtobacterium sp. MCBA15_004]
MTTEVTDTTTGFWYGTDSRVDAVDVLNALRRYRSAESAAQRRAREALGIGENALLALRVLLDAEAAGRAVNAKELADRLDITPASTSALVDRLVRSGHVERHADPHDRRGVLLTATGGSMRQVLQVIDELDNRAIEVAEHLPPSDMAVVVGFLEQMARVVGRDIESADPARRSA